MIVKLLTEHHLEFPSLKEAAEAHPSLHMSKCHIVRNLMHWHLNFAQYRFENRCLISLIIDIDKQSLGLNIIEPRHVISNNVAF